MVALGKSVSDPLKNTILEPPLMGVGGITNNSTPGPKQWSKYTTALKNVNKRRIYEL